MECGLIRERLRAFGGGIGGGNALRGFAFALRLACASCRAFGAGTVKRNPPFRFRQAA